MPILSSTADLGDTLVFRVRLWFLPSLNWLTSAKQLVALGFQELSPGWIHSETSLEKLARAPFCV